MFINDVNHRLSRCIMLGDFKTVTVHFADDVIGVILRVCARASEATLENLSKWTT